MGALERYDQWERSVDEVLAESATEVATPTLADIYDPTTLAAIEAHEQPVATPVSGWRGGVAAGAMVVGLVHGVRDALDTQEDEAVVELHRSRADHRLEHVTVHLAWGNPAASVAIVRVGFGPWGTAGSGPRGTEALTEFVR